MTPEEEMGILEKALKLVLDTRDIGPWIEWEYCGAKIRERINYKKGVIEREIQPNFPVEFISIEFSMNLDV